MPGPRRRALIAVTVARPVLAAAGLFVWYFLSPIRRPFTTVTALELAGGLAAVGVLVAWQARAIARSPYPGLRAIAALALSFFSFVVLFAASYVVISTTEPAAFNEPISRIDGIYFTITTFATVGFGDIAARSEQARVVVTFQILADLVFVGLVVRVFVQAARRGKHRGSTNAGRIR